MPVADVCAGLTTAPSAHWAAAGAAECDRIIDATVWSFVVPLYVAAYFYAAWRIASIAWRSMLARMTRMNSK